MASTDSYGPNLRRVSILARWMLGGWNALEAPASDQITSYEVRHSSIPAAPADHRPEAHRPVQPDLSGAHGRHCRRLAQWRAGRGRGGASAATGLPERGGAVGGWEARALHAKTSDEWLVLPRVRLGRQHGSRRWVMAAGCRRSRLSTSSWPSPGKTRRRPRRAVTPSSKSNTSVPVFACVAPASFAADGIESPG